MSIACRGVRKAVLAAGLIGWLAMFGLVAWQLVSPGGEWMSQRYALMALAAVVSISSTVSGVVLATVPALYDVWHEGVGFGRRQEARERRTVSLRLVKQ